MKRVVAAMALAIFWAGSASGADEASVLFRVSVKQEGRDIASPAFLAKVGEPTKIRMGEGLALEALAKPVGPDGDAWTQVRITYFETPDGTMVQEMTMRHPRGIRTGSFEYTDAAKRRYVVKVGK